MLKIRTALGPASHWRELYQAALFETDRHRLGEKITVAERALVMRGRELFFAEDMDPAEQRAVEQALNSLHALENCLGLKRKAS